MGESKNLFPSEACFCGRKRDKSMFFISITGTLTTFSLQNPWFCGENYLSKIVLLFATINVLFYIGHHTIIQYEIVKNCNPSTDKASEEIVNIHKLHGEG